MNSRSREFGLRNEWASFNKTHGVAFMDGRGLAVYLCFAFAVEDVVNLFDPRMPMFAFGRPGRQQEVVHVGPVGQKHGCIERTPVPDRAFSITISG